MLKTIKNRSELDKFDKNVKKVILCRKPEQQWQIRERRVIQVPSKFKYEKLKEKLKQNQDIYSTKVLTTECGKSKDGKYIEIDNVSKWLFGVPGCKGHLASSPARNSRDENTYIMFPKETPAEIIDIIQEPIAKDQISYAETLSKMMRTELSMPQMHGHEKKGKLEKDLKLVSNELKNTADIIYGLVDTKNHPEYRKAYDKICEESKAFTRGYEPYVVLHGILQNDLQELKKEEEKAAIQYARSKSDKDLDVIVKAGKKLMDIYQTVDAMSDAMEDGKIETYANDSEMFERLYGNIEDISLEIQLDIQMDVHNPEDLRLVYNLEQRGKPAADTREQQTLIDD